jgi:hypothetical protein
MIGDYHYLITPISGTIKSKLFGYLLIQIDGFPGRSLWEAHILPPPLDILVSSAQHGEESS